ncbi:MAG: ergothioneine biosynthesis protein EgtB [Gammaproteobacteria bacterium]|nr:ergothioneine biosynthesis protein EgtB [Gammaproteobacteria bacterium]
MLEAAQVADDPIARYAAVRQQTEMLCRPLAVDDYGVQPMDDASPPKWHLAHTTWFFETFLLKPFRERYRPFAEGFETLFNSYYNGVGQPFPRPRRGTLSRPTVEEVYAYRAHVDAAMRPLLARGDDEIRARVELGLHHEQQHQELIVTDLKVTLGGNPLRPAYRDDLDRTACESRPATFVEFPEGFVEIGAIGAGFCFDNETPRHRVWLRPFAVADRLVTNVEYLAFMEDGGYRTPALWLSDGWDAVRRDAWEAPLYWYRDGGAWSEYRLSGPAPVDPHAPVTHVSFYEADAYARWAGARLPLEAEWESVAARYGEEVPAGNFADGGRLHPRTPVGSGMAQLFGDAWEWTSSAYVAYPGYRPLPGTLGEYNGKFMANQVVLRGGSCATPPGHVRATYRNFFHGPDRWQFTGIRLARDAG